MMAANRLESAQKAYENTLGFQKGYSVYVYTGGTRHTFLNVRSLRVNIIDSILTIDAPGSITIFHSWSGIGVVCTEQTGDFDLRAMT